MRIDALIKIFPLLLTLSLCAEPVVESSSLSSASADYDGNTLTLKGQVVLDHGLGQMIAEEALLQRQEAGKDFPFSLIHLQKGVNLKMPDRAHLTCDVADFDFVSLKGLLLSKTEDKVCYTDNLNKKGNPQGLFRLMSSAIELDLSKKGHDGKKTTYELETLVAKGEVIVDYAQAFTLRADHAIYRKEIPSDKAIDRELQGVVTAYPKDASSKCRLTHEGDIIDAETVDLDLVHSRLSLYHPIGVLLSPLVPGLQKSEIAFQADKLTWDHLKNTLTLQGKARVKESSLGTIDAEEQLQLTQGKVKGKTVLQSLRSQGKTTFHYQDPAHQTEHRLISHGPLFLDREHLRLSLESPESDGEVLPEEQIYYEEAELALYADRAALDYSVIGGALQPVSLTLKGGVRLLSRDPKRPALCGVSDRISYSPATRTLILSADPGKKVLFWDEEQGLRMTSQEIHVTQDAVSKQRAVKGVGNVNFAFSTEETALLQKIFPLYKVLPHE